MQFRSTIELGGKTATGFEVPGRVVDELGAGKRPAVQVTVNGHRFRSTVAVMGGRFLLPLNAQNRAAAGVAAGDEVTVDIELDTAPRVVEVPADLAAALDAAPAARARFDGLPTACSGGGCFRSRTRRPTHATASDATLVQTLASEAG